MSGFETLLCIGKGGMGSVYYLWRFMSHIFFSGLAKRNHVYHTKQNNFPTLSLHFRNVKFKTCPCFFFYLVVRLEHIIKMHDITRVTNVRTWGGVVVRKQFLGC